MDYALSTASRRATARPHPVSRLLGVMALRRSRLRLADLDDYLLRDVGLTRNEARCESERTSWNAPDHWLR